MKSMQPGASFLIGPMLIAASFIAPAFHTGGHAADNVAVEFGASQVAAIFLHGPWPGPMPADPGNELSGNTLAQALGESLFNDPGLSADGKISCSTCHLPQFGFSDGKARATGLASHHRNTQGLLDVGLQRWFGWDGGADSLWAASLRPMLSPIEMGGTVDALARTLQRHPEFQKARGQLNRLARPHPDGKTPIAQSDVVLAAKSIAAYVRTLRSPTTRFDRFRVRLAANYKPSNGEPTVRIDETDEFSVSALRGLKLFVGKARCNVCHYGPNFSNGEFHDIGRPFIPAPGQIDPGRYRGIERVRADPYNLSGQFGQLAQATPGSAPPSAVLKLTQVNWGQWRTPSLRNLLRTAPYMHDGSLNDLRTVVDWYADIDVSRLHSNGETILRPLDLSNDQRNDLVTFLESLSGK